MSMFCMNCSALGAAPLTVACSCGSVRWRGTYELPERPAVVGVTISNYATGTAKVERDLNGNIQVTASEAGDRQVLDMVDAIRRMIAEGRVDVPGIVPDGQQD